MVHCNNTKCKYYTEQRCTSPDVFYIDRLCVSYRKRPREDRIEDLMRAPFDSNCHATSKGYKSNGPGKLLR